MKKSLWLVLLLLFYLSGASGLIYEIIWVRMFSLVFGNTNYAATIVLSAFFVGMALGSLFFGRRSDAIEKPFRMYGFLEIVIGLSALAVPSLISTIDGFYPHLYRNLGENNPLFFLIRFLLSFAIVLIPTFFMGGTLPLIIKVTSLVREEFGKSVSLLYALNTFGGVTGSFVSGFFLIRYTGIQNTILVAALLNILVGCAALGFSRLFQTAPTSAQESTGTTWGDKSLVQPQQFPLSRIMLIIAFLTGLLSLAFEVVWARLLVYILSSSVYAFNIMLTTFLFGIALGSLIAKKIIRRSKDIVNLCGFFLWCIGAYGFLTIPLLVLVAVNDEGIMSFFGLATWPRYTAGRFVESAVILFPPTLLMGIVFPLIASIVKSEQASGSRVIGNVYFINTVGAIVGSAVGGFLLIPFLGCKWSIVVLSVVYASTGVFLIIKCGRVMILRFGAVFLTAAVILAAVIQLRGNPFIPLFNIREQGSEISYIREGTTGTVTVHRHPDYKVININRVNVAGTSFVLRTTQKLQGFLPLLVCKEPKLVCQIGFGSGETSSIVVRYEGVERLDVVDISYEVFDAAPEFKDINHGLFDSDKLNKIVMDGKNYMHLTDQRYDLIMNDSIHPVECGNASLYTREYFKDCRSRLREGGVMSSWFPIFALSSQDFKSLIRTFNSVFPGCTLWVGNNCVNRHALLIGRKDGNDVEIDFSFIKQAIQREWIREELAEIRMFTVYDVLDSFMLNGEAIKEFTKDADINTDMHPILEYRSPTTLDIDPVLLAGNISDMLEVRSNVYDNLTNVPNEERLVVKKALDLFMKSTAYIYRGHVNDIMDAYGGVVQNYAKAAEVNALDLDGVYLIKDIEEREHVLFEKYVKEKATYPELIELSVLNLKLGEIRKATQTLERGLKRDPHNLSLLYSLFGIYQKLQDEDNQERIIDMLVKVDDNSDVFFQKGLFLGRGGEYDEATQFFEKAISIKEDSAKYHFYLGLSLQNLGDEALRRDVQLGYYRKALKSYKRAKELDVQNEFSVDEYIVPLKYELSPNG